MIKATEVLLKMAMIGTITITAFWTAGTFVSKAKTDNAIQTHREEMRSRNLVFITNYSDMLAKHSECKKIKVHYSAMSSSTTSVEYELSRNRLERLIEEMGKDGEGIRLEMSMFSSLATPTECEFSYSKK